MSETAAKKDVQKLQRTIVDALEDVKAQDIRVFNTEHLSPLFERVIVASGTSNRQTKALAASVREKVRDAGFGKPRIEGEDNGEWIIVDCGAAVAHVMQPAIRQYYNLEEIWGDKPLKLKGPTSKATKPSTAAKKPTKSALAPTDKAQPATKKVASKKAPVAKKAATAKPATRQPAAPGAAKTAARKTAPRAGSRAPLQTVVVNQPAAPRGAAKAGAKTAAKAATKPATKPAAKPATKPAAKAPAKRGR